jgi:chloramphenicol 3-O-phosphotransferase
MPAVFLLTGPSAAGKTTVARLLAERFARGVHLEGDLFRRAIVAGREEVSPEPPPEALAQLRLRYRLGAAAADEYFRHDFTVVLEDVVAGPVLPEWVAMIHSTEPRLVVLLPSAEVVAARELARRESGYALWSVGALHGLFADDTTRLGLWLDTSSQTPPETVDEILASCT